MKREDEKRNQMGIFILTLSILWGASTVYAQVDDDALVRDAESVFSSEKIDIEGRWGRKAPRPKKRKLTNAQIIKNARKKSARKNIQEIAKEVEQIQVSSDQIENILNKEDKRLSQGIDDAFGGKAVQNIAAEDSVSIEQGSNDSTVAAVAETMPSSDEGHGRKESKIIPSIGIAHINGDAIDFESKVSVGLNFESEISSRFSLGVGINYTTLDVEEIDNSRLYNNDYYSYYSYSNCGYANCSGYNNFYGSEGRNLNYKHWTLEFNGKFFITDVDSRVRPYVGLGIAYNRTSLKYDDRDNGNVRNSGGGYYNSQYNFRYGNESYSSSYVSGSAFLGAEINFTETVGMNLDIKYAKGLTGGFDSKSAATSPRNTDQQKLDRIGENIEESDILAITSGLIIRF